ncbi:6967_t:CDS:2 [Funneliformis geosporum]|nr:6967_t:CDS:2 [Funneliformis geosporum]
MIDSILNRKKNMIVLDRLLINDPVSSLTFMDNTNWIAEN